MSDPAYRSSAASDEPGLARPGPTQYSFSSASAISNRSAVVP